MEAAHHTSTLPLFSTPPVSRSHPPWSRHSHSMPPRRRAAAPAPAPAASVRRQAPATAAESARRRPGRASPPAGPVVTLRRLLGVVAVVTLSAGYAAARLAGQAYVQSLFADFEAGQPAAVSRADAETHAGLFVVDLHCDASFSRRCVLGPGASPPAVGLTLRPFPLLSPVPDSRHCLLCLFNQQPAGPGRPERVRHLALRALPRGRPSPGCRQRRAPGAWKLQQQQQHTRSCARLTGRASLPPGQVFTSFTSVPSAPVCHGPLPLCHAAPVRPMRTCCLRQHAPE